MASSDPYKILHGRPITMKKGGGRSVGRFRMRGLAVTGIFEKTTARF